MNIDILLQTAFAFMACDGEIVQEEIDLIKKMEQDGVFQVENVDATISELVAQLNSEGKQFLKHYLNNVEKANLSGEEALRLLKVAVRTIYADADVTYSEVKFFRAVRMHLNAIDNAAILKGIPEIEDFWLESDLKSDVEGVEKDYFENIEFSLFDLKEITHTPT